MMKIAAIILAAGESRRMGEPKALARFGQQSFLEAIIASFQSAGLEDLAVVLGHDASNVLGKVQHLPVQFVINKDYPSGQFSSFQTGLAALPPIVDGAFLALVDQPQIGSHIISVIKEAFLANPQKIIIPTFNGRRGHPPIFPRSVFEEIVLAPDTETATKIVRSHPELIREIQVASESVLWNINTKEELAEVRRRINL